MAIPIASYIAPDLFYFDPGFPSSTTNCSEQLYTQRAPTINVGYVFSAPVLVSFMVYNGSGSAITLTQLLETATAGITYTGISQGQVIPAQTSVIVVFTVTQFGSLAFTSSYQFSSANGTVAPVLTISGTRPMISTDQPCPINMTDAMAEAYAYADPSVTFYDTLEFYSELDGSYVRVVCSDEQLVTPDGTFEACYFSFTLPETQGSTRGQMQITVDFLPRDAQIWIRNATQSRSSITVKWRQYLGPNIPADAEYPVPLNITTISQNPTGVTATALFPDLVNLPFPRLIMTTTELPGGIM